MFVQACKYAMRVCAPVVGSEQITTMFQNHLHEDKSLHYGEFINDLTKYLVRHTQPLRQVCLTEDEMHLDCSILNEFDLDSCMFFVDMEIWAEYLDRL